MSDETFGKCNTNNKVLMEWVGFDTVGLCEPDRVFWCDGSEAEKEFLTAEAVAKGILIK